MKCRAFYRSPARRTGIAARIPQLKSAPVNDKTYWANPLAPQPTHGSVGGAMDETWHNQCEYGTNFGFMGFVFFGVIEISGGFTPSCEQAATCS
jgi:hypothetical protein